MNKISRPKNLTHPKYRADIDGLRAIAVLLVVFFHVADLEGGFIGVDIFFVISGFLISTIIFKNLESNSFSFVEFYSRRIRRIFPALLLVLVASFAFGWFALMNDEYKQLGKHIAGGAGFISNFILLKEDGYFDNISETKPLLHLWSLGIEEQFYIIWPFILWFIYKNKLKTLPIVVAIASISFVFGIFEVYHNKIAAFYLPQARFWELLSGSILAYIAVNKDFVWNWRILKLGNLSRIQTKITQTAKDNFISTFGLLLIIVCVAVLNKDKSFPGFWALLPVIGAVLIISANPRAFVNRKILANPILVWFGKISFPLYLWHWPLLSFATIIESNGPERKVRALIILSSIVLAWLTYEFVEKPIRFGKSNRRKTIVVILLTFAVGFVGFQCFNKNGLEHRASIKGFDNASADLIVRDATRESDGSCNSYLNIDEARGLVCLTNSSAPEVLIIGDSHAMSLNSAAHLNKIAVKTLLIAGHSCLPFSEYDIIVGKESRSKCRNIYNQALDAIKKIPSIKTVILNSRGPYYFSGTDFPTQNASPYHIAPNFNQGQKMTQEEMFVNGYSQLAEDLLVMDKNVIFVIDFPELDFDPRVCSSRPFREKPSNSECKISKKIVLARQSVYRKAIAEIKQRNPKLLIFDSAQVLCDKEFCYGRDANSIYYFDNDHLSVSGSSKILNELIKNSKNVQ